MSACCSTRERRAPPSRPATFAACRQLRPRAASNPYGLIATDLNGDGKTDLAVANFGSSQLSVLVGNGDGTFQTAYNYAISGSPIGVTVGDFNGDGIPDLITSNYYGDNVTVLLGNAAKTLPVDAATGLASGYGRGNVSSSADVDYFSWTGKAGDQVQLASENPGAAPAAGLLYEPSYFVLEAPRHQ